MQPPLSPPPGRVRVSEAVLDKLVVSAAHEVCGVVDIDGMVLGAVLGGVAGGAVGLLEGGPIGAALGGSVGATLGAMAGQLVRQYHDRHTFYEAAEGPTIQVRLTASYGPNLTQLAEAVRVAVCERIQEDTGLSVARVDVEFVAIAALPASTSTASLMPSYG